jgi:hypothetical protein
MYVRNSLCPWSFHMFGNAKQLNYLINAMEKSPCEAPLKHPWLLWDQSSLLYSKDS